MENLTNWCVYMHTNRFNDKKYVGVTSLKPTNRWQNGDGYKRCPIFYAAIKKYGWDAFRHEILYTGLTQEEAERLEVDLIAKYDTQNRSRGYNLAAGGGVNHGFHRTEDFKVRLSATRRANYIKENHPLYGKHRSEETKQKIRKSNLGKPRSEEAKAKMRESARKRWSADNQSEREYFRQLYKGANSPVARAVVCVETGKVYGTSGLASEATGTESTGITRCCKGQRQTAGGYHWRYADEAVTVDG